MGFALAFGERTTGSRMEGGAMERRRFMSLLFMVVLIALVGGLAAGPTWAENIDPNNDDSQFAFGENVGWFNAEPSGNGGPGVEVSDTELTGWLWAENVGWVSLSCVNTSSCATVNYGVTNDGAGNLSGFGWAENVGWISFSCENTASCASAASRSTST